MADVPAHAPLFKELKLGRLTAPNRIMMAPLTRARSTPGENVQTDLHAVYYSQRAGAGLVISEATNISRQGQGYAWTPGIFSDAQVDGWKPVTDAVHAADGRIFCQLWHVGAISHNVFHDGAAPVSSSVWTPKGEAFVGDLHPDGPTVPHPEARALTTEEIAGVLEDYRHAAKCADKAGFDGVEFHGANGYLIDQFLRTSVNTRDDAYGGSVENRVRLLVEGVDAVIDVLGADRVGVRLSPAGGAGGSKDENPMETYVAAAKALSGKGLAYLHVVRSGEPENTKVVDAMRDAFDGPFIINGGFTPEEAAQWIDEGRADAVAFGKLYIANPDLDQRIAMDGPYNDPNPDTFYGGGAKGYTDYPIMDGTAQAAE